MTMNILMTVNEEWLKHAKATVLSVRGHTQEDTDIVLYLVHTIDDKDMLNAFMEDLADGGVNVYLIELSRDTVSVIEKSGKTLQGISMDSYYRLLAPYVLPEDIDRILYLDGDTLIVNDISDMYFMDFNTCIAACPDTPNAQTYSNVDLIKAIAAPDREKFQYVNSGVMLMNPQMIRSLYTPDNIMKAIEYFGPTLVFGDQDIINLLFSKSITYLDKKYNAFYTDGNIKDACIYHYVGQTKPWTFTDNFKKMYSNYWEFTDRAGLN